MIEEVQLAEAAGGRGCRPSEPLLPARGEAGHSKLLRAAQTGFEPQLLFAPAGQASAAREALCRKVVLAIFQSHFACAGMWYRKVPRPNIGIAILRFAYFVNKIL